jgi:hypothetical protein
MAKAAISEMSSSPSPIPASHPEEGNREALPERTVLADREPKFGEFVNEPAYRKALQENMIAAEYGGTFYDSQEDILEMGFYGGWKASRLSQAQPLAEQVQRVKLFPEEIEFQLQATLAELEQARRYAKLDQESRKYWSVRGAELEIDLAKAEALLERSEWRSVDQELPREVENGYRWVQVYDVEWETQYYASWDGEEWHPLFDRAIGRITHWKPLDAPPVSEKGAK